MLARRYLWNEIADVESHRRIYGPALRLRLHDGSQKYAWAVMSGKAGLDTTSEEKGGRDEPLVTRRMLGLDELHLLWDRRNQSASRSAYLAVWR